MSELDYKESRAPKNWCFWTVLLEKTLESPLDCKEIQPVHPKGDQSWVFFGRTDVEAEIPLLWPPDVKSWLVWKNPDAGKDWGQGEKGTTEDEMVGWHHWLDGHGFGWTQEVGDGQGGLACCDSWGCKESDTTEQLNWTELISRLSFLSIWKQNSERVVLQSHFDLDIFLKLYFKRKLKPRKIQIMFPPAFSSPEQLWERKGKPHTNDSAFIWLLPDQSHTAKNPVLGPHFRIYVNSVLIIEFLISPC